MDKERKKIVRRKMGWIMIRVSFCIIKVLPLKLVLYLGRTLGTLGYSFSRRHRRIALESLGIAFSGEKPYAEIKNIAKKCFAYMGEASWEIIYFINNLSAIKERVEIIGLDNLQEALAKKKGVIAISAHFGNFPLMLLRLKEEGFTVNTMTRPMRDEKTGDFLYKLRTDLGIKTVFSYPKREAVFGSLRALDNNEILLIQMDQNFGTGGVWVDFFGKLAATPVGPIILGLRSNAAIVPMFMVRKNSGKHTLFIEKEVLLERKEDKEETVLVNVIKFTKIIESWIRKYPELWGWIHRRWKSRPDQKVFSRKYKVQKV